MSNLWGGQSTVALRAEVATGRVASWSCRPLMAQSFCTAACCEVTGLQLRASNLCLRIWCHGAMAQVFALLRLRPSQYSTDHHRQSCNASHQYQAILLQQPLRPSSLGLLHASAPSTDPCQEPASACDLNQVLWSFQLSSWRSRRSASSQGISLSTDSWHRWSQAPA